MSKTKSVVRWALLIGAMAVAVVCLNSALYRTWIAGGPPNANAAGWQFSATNYFLFTAAAALGGIALFKLIGSLPALNKSSLVLLALAASAALAPTAREFIAVDRCLDAGGQWSELELKCQH